MQILEFQQRISAVKDDLMAAVRQSIPDGLMELKEPYTAHIKIKADLVSLEVSGFLQDKGVYLVGTRIPDGKKMFARDNDLDCETLLDVLVRAQFGSNIPDGTEFLPESFSGDDDVGKLMKILIGGQPTGSTR